MPSIGLLRSSTWSTARMNWKIVSPIGSHGFAKIGANHAILDERRAADELEGMSPGGYARDSPPALRQSESAARGVLALAYLRLNLRADEEI